jgi:alpha-N-arabinofuranosidase
VTAVRYPGGNFVSGYRWEDGVGPAHERPTRLDPAWRSIETNRFGLHEFMDWAGKAGVDPIMVVNLGTRGIEDASRLVEYSNHASGTALSDLRINNGATDPFGITTWCLGNEMDGPWQTGHKDADTYGRLAAEAGKTMRQIDPSIRLVACGSSHEQMPTFGQWEATVLRHCYDVVDYISLHAYYEQHGDDVGSFLASGHAMDRFIDGVIATADHVRAVTKSRKKIQLSFDEWNVWYASRFAGHTNLEWEEAPRLIEDTYSTIDAVVVGNLLMSLLRHADRVAIACLAQLVNVIGPIRAEPGAPAWRQTIFHPFALTSRAVRGEVLRVEPVVDSYPTDRHGDAPLVDALASLEDSGEIVVLAVNRSEDAIASLDIRMNGAGRRVVTSHQRIGGGSHDLAATNTVDTPDRVTPAELRDSASVLADDGLSVALDPVSWNLIRLSGAAGLA